jgi:hypothetical protein
LPIENKESVLMPASATPIFQDCSRDDDVNRIQESELDEEVL